MHSLRLPSFALLSLACLVHGGLARAEAPRGSYVPADLGRVDVAEPQSHTSNIIYLNGCFGSGCDITPGIDSSTANTSSIPSSASHIPPFSGGQMEWDAIVDCVRDTYKPFNIVITDEDPGPVDHFEAIVAGEPTDVGMPQGVGGVAPFSCGGFINNGITFTFSEIFSNKVAETCWTVAQETAHAFGLDHEYLCSDPMTYLQSCDPNKRFQDQDAQCGEYQGRPCSCNGNTQNSYRYLLDHFGAGIKTPPSLQITSPADGDDVEAGFIVRATAEDDIAIDRLELRINSVSVGVSESSPYIFNAPDTVSEGRLRVEVTAFDNYDYATTETIEVLMGEPCSKNSNCGQLEACVDGRCVPGPEVEGGLGDSCSSDTQCASLRCGQSSEGNFCTETCEAGGGGCPAGFGCLETGESSVCWPGYDDDDGGCSTGGARGSASALACFGIALLLLRRRRRRC